MPSCFFSCFFVCVWLSSRATPQTTCQAGFAPIGSSTDVLPVIGKYFRGAASFEFVPCEAVADSEQLIDVWFKCDNSVSGASDKDGNLTKEHDLGSVQLVVLNEKSPTMQLVILWLFKF